MKILIMGSGGIGGYYGARLAQSGTDVFFVARGAHLEAIRKNGLKVTSVKGSFHLPQVPASSEPLDAGPVDVVILGTKAWDVETAAAQVKPVLKPNGFLVHFQNGVDIAQRLAKTIPREQIVGGVEYGVVQVLAPGHIDHSTQVQQLIYGAFQRPAPERLDAFHLACQGAGFDALLVEDIETRIWSKFLFICAYSGVTSLLRLPIGPIVGDPDTFALYERCMREIERLAQAKKIALPPGIVEDRLEFSRKLEPSSTSSMQRDLAAGKKMELDALNGTVSRLGREMGVLTPINDLIYSALKLHASGQRTGEL
jgi:2-dehydropantoate 2-reductase